MSDISVYVTLDLTTSERRISPQWHLHYLKQKLELITGIEPQHQELRYHPLPSSNEFQVLGQTPYNEEADKTTPVALLGIASYSRIHVLDANPESQLAELDDEKVDGFKLSEEEYAKRSDTVLRWKQEKGLGRFDPQYDAEKQRRADENEAVAAKITVGDRCRVINIQGQRLGLVRYVGRIKELDDDTWVGVEFDEPVGRNDGSIDGKRYFDAKANHGSFLRPKQVEVGDFPEEDPFASDDEL